MNTNKLVQILHLLIYKLTHRSKCKPARTKFVPTFYCKSLTLMITFFYFNTVTGPVLYAGETDSFIVTATPQDIWQPTQVTDLSVIPGTNEGQVKLEWTAPYEDTGFTNNLTPVVGYYIKYSTTPISSLFGNVTTWWNSAEGQYQITYANPPGSKETAILNLYPGTTYYFGIKSYDDIPSLISFIDTKSELPDGQTVLFTTDYTPDIPQGLQVSTQTKNTVTLFWDDLSYSGKSIDFVGYSIYRSTDGIDFNYLTQTSTTYFKDTLLIPETSYYYRISAVDDLPTKLESQLSFAVTGYTLLPEDKTAPSAITDLVAETGIQEGQVKLYWSAPGDDGNDGPIVNGTWQIAFTTITNYQLPMTNFRLEISTTVNPFAKINHSITGLNPGTTYYFAIRTTDVKGNLSPESNIATGSSQDLVPETVKNFTVFAPGETGRILLSWMANTEPDLKEYRVYRSTESVQLLISSMVYLNPGFNLPVKSLPRGTTNWEDKDLTDLVTYYYRLTAVDFSGKESQFTQEQSTYPYTIILYTEISGTVTQKDGSPVALVLCETIAGDINQLNRMDNLDTIPTSTDKLPIIKTVYTDDKGMFIFTGLTLDTTYLVRVTLAEKDKQSRVYREVLSGTSRANFSLEINYQLATLSGELSLRQHSSNGGTNFSPGLSTKRSFRSITEITTRGYIEISRPDYGVKNEQAKLYLPVSPDGRYEIKNLLPGRYAVRAYDGVVYSNRAIVSIDEGELKKVQLSFPELPAEQVRLYPNPSTIGQVTIKFYTTYMLPESEITIYTVVGEQVRLVLNRDIKLLPGDTHYSYVWDGKNETGSNVVSGVYLSIISVKDRITNRTSKVMKKIALIR